MLFNAVLMSTQPAVKLATANFELMMRFTTQELMRRGISGNKVLCELAALIRCLDRCDESDTSPFADADNGQEECDRTCTT